LGVKREPGFDAVSLKAGVKIADIADKFDVFLRRVFTFATRLRLPSDAS
jgi:hypothetical protein